MLVKPQFRENGEEQKSEARQSCAVAAGPLITSVDVCGETCSSVPGKRTLRFYGAWLIPPFESSR